MRNISLGDMGYKEIHQEKRVSPYCKKVEERVFMTRKWFIIIFVLLLVLPLLYVIPCYTTMLKIKFSPSLSSDQFIVSSFENDSQSYHNLSINNGNSFGYADWAITSINLYLNPYNPILTSTEMLQYVVYDVPNDDILNTIRVNVYNDISGYNYQFAEIDGKRFEFILPVDYVLSYLEVTIESLRQLDEYFSVSFYHFFQDDIRIDLKFLTISEINIREFSFNEAAFDHWYMWKYQSGDIPSNYPYLLDVDIKRYNEVTEMFGVDSI